MVSKILEFVIDFKSIIFNTSQKHIKTDTIIETFKIKTYVMN